MKAEEWLTYFIKIYGRRPKMTEVDEAIQNGSLLANRVEVESLLLASKKSFWQTLSQYVVTHKVAASVLAVSCMTLLGGGAIFAWHSHHSQAQQTSSLAVASSSSQSGQTFYFADNGPGHGSILLCLCQPIKQHRLRTILSKTQIVWFKFQSLLGQGWFTRLITE